MVFEFVVETPERRGINRFNHKLIQKRATQAGARTKLAVKAKTRDHDLEQKALRQPIDEMKIPTDDVRAAALPLSVSNLPPFLASFGDIGSSLYLEDLGFSKIIICTGFTGLAPSVFQKRVIAEISSCPYATDANRLFKITRLTQTQFLKHLPSHYGELRFLDDAIECLITRLHAFMPLVQATSNRCPPGLRSPTMLYTKALRSLRTAIDNAQEQDLPYVWYTVMILTLFELLSTNDEPGWIWHAAGAARILYGVGAENIRSEFHLSLLAAQCRIQVTETLFNDKPCFLADSQWQDAIRRTILKGDNFGDRSAVSTELWRIGASIPNAFRSVTEYVGDSRQFGRNRVLSFTVNILRNMDTWEARWRPVLETTCHNTFAEGGLRQQSMSILLAFFMLSTILLRLRIAVGPYQAHSWESRAQEACTNAFQHRLYATDFGMYDTEPLGVDGSIYLRVAVATQQTGSRWSKAVDGAGTGQCIDNDTFAEWSTSMRRTSAASQENAA